MVCHIGDSQDDDFTGALLAEVVPILVEDGTFTLIEPQSVDFEQQDVVLGETRETLVLKDLLRKLE